MNNLNINSYEDKINILNHRIIEFIDILYEIIKNDNIVYDFDRHITLDSKSVTLICLI